MHLAGVVDVLFDTEFCDPLEKRFELPHLTELPAGGGQCEARVDSLGEQGGQGVDGGLEILVNPIPRDEEDHLAAVASPRLHGTEDFFAQRLIREEEVTIESIAEHGRAFVLERRVGLDHLSHGVGGK